MAANALRAGGHVLAGLNHPNIVTVHDYGHTADGSFDYAIELLDGMDREAGHR
jgi:hypothetical protein